MAESNWGRWGDDDERGALNLLTPDVVKAAASAITTGKIYPLGIPIQSAGVPLMDYRGTPMRLTLQDATDEGMYDIYGAHEGTGAHEDVLVMASHTTSHMDALVHVYGEGKHYNAVDKMEMKAQTGAGRLGIDKVGAIAGRAVLFDMAAHMPGPDGWVELGRNITADDLKACQEAQGVELRAGDIALIRTGYLDMWFATEPPHPFEQAGIGKSAADWLASMDIVAVGSDNAAVEVIPFDENDFLGVHKELLVKAGIYMLEFLDFGQMAADKCYEGFMTVSPLKVTGATGSPINPVVIG